MSKFTITIKDNKTGETKRIIYDNAISKDAPEEQHELVEFMWTDGNNGCDCNLYNVFYPEEESGIDMPCYSEGYENGKRFEVESIIPLA